MLTKSKLSKGHSKVAWNSHQLSTLKLNYGVFQSKYGINSLTVRIIVVDIQCKDEGKQRRNYLDKYQEYMYLMTTDFKLI